MKTLIITPDWHLGTPDPELVRLQLLDTISFLGERLAEAEEAKDFDLIRWYEKELSTKKALLPMTDEDLKILKFHADDMAYASEDHTYEDGHALQRVLAFVEMLRSNTIPKSAVLEYLRHPSISRTFEADEIESGQWLARLLPEDEL